MFKFFLIPDPEKFLRLVEQSHGDVTLHLPDGTVVDLKQNNAVKQLLRIMMPGVDGILISLSNPSDMSAFMNYMAGCRAAS